MRELITLVLLFATSFTFAQTKWMLVEQKNGQKDSVAIESINKITFVTSNNTVIDIDGNVYHTVIIGNQEWTVENLRVTHYNNGTDITKITTDNSAWITNTTGAFCAYDNNESNVATFGYLYNWHAANTGKLAPTTGGWRVPTDADLTTLTDFIGGELNAGTTLKSKSGWVLNGNGTDDYGFSMLPGGYRAYTTGAFFGKDWDSSIWSSTSNDEIGGWNRSFNYNNTYVIRSSNRKMDGRSIRLVRTVQ